MTADFDGDGRLEIVVNNFNDQPYYFKNKFPKRNYVAFRLTGTRSNRDAIGAKLTLRAGTQRGVRWITGGSSYLSSSDKRIVFGVPNGSQALDLEIIWPSGTVQHVGSLTTLRYHRIVEPGVHNPQH